MARPDAEYVRWVDSSAIRGKTWFDLADIVPDANAPDKCETVGFVIAESDESIMLTLSYIGVTPSRQNESVEPPLVIPKVAITHRQKLRLHRGNHRPGKAAQE